MTDHLSINLPMTTEAKLAQVQPTGKRGGRWVTLGDERYRVPALSLGAYQALQDRIAVIETLQQGGGRVSPEQIAAMFDVLHAALVRNYPEITREQVAEMVDLENFQEVLLAALNVHGASPIVPAGEEPQ